MLLLPRTLFIVQRCSYITFPLEGFISPPQRFQLFLTKGYWYFALNREQRHHYEPKSRTGSSSYRAERFRSRSNESFLSSSDSSTATLRRLFPSLYNWLATISLNELLYAWRGCLKFFPQWFRFDREKLAPRMKWIKRFTMALNHLEGDDPNF